jgi:hypothetical protein
MKQEFSNFVVTVLPRKVMNWRYFFGNTPPNSIALDGIVLGGPYFDEKTYHINFDHHDHVEREATMSTAMQVYFAIKGGLMKAMILDDKSKVNIYINDTDQDTALAVWLLLNYKKFEGTQSIPHINRLLALTDRLDITGGAFPMSLDDRLLSQHNWIFQPYTDLRKSGGIATASGEILMSNLEATMSHLDKYLMGEAEEVELDTRHEILYDSAHFKIVDEIGGNDARYHLFSNGMDAFISLVAKPRNGRYVYSIGRRSRYIRFPVKALYEDFNAAEGLSGSDIWGGSDIIGGSPRENGSGLDPQFLYSLTIKRLNKEGILK